MPNIDEAIEALLAYRQADMEGVMVLTSRQAIHEVADELRRLRAQSSESFLEQSHRDNNWIGLSASEKAAYDWPDDTELHRQCRAAYVAGATDYQRIPDAVGREQQP